MSGRETQPCNSTQLALFELYVLAPNNSLWVSAQTATWLSYLMLACLSGLPLLCSTIAIAKSYRSSRSRQDALLLLATSFGWLALCFRVVMIVDASAFEGGFDTLRSYCDLVSSGWRDGLKSDGTPPPQQGGATTGDKIASEGHAADRLGCSLMNSPAERSMVQFQLCRTGFHICQAMFLGGIWAIFVLFSNNIEVVGEIKRPKSLSSCVKFAGMMVFVADIVMSVSLPSNIINDLRVFEFVTAFAFAAGMLHLILLLRHMKRRVNRRIMQGSNYKVSQLHSWSLNLTLITIIIVTLLIVRTAAVGFMLWVFLTTEDGGDNIIQMLSTLNSSLTSTSFLLMIAAGRELASLVSGIVVAFPDGLLSVFSEDDVVESKREKSVQTKNTDVTLTPSPAPTLKLRSPEALVHCDRGQKDKTTDANLALSTSPSVKLRPPESLVHWDNVQDKTTAANLAPSPV